MRPIHIFSRQCFSSPNQNLQNRNRPEWFFRGRCWKNLIATIGVGVDITVFYDYAKGKMGYLPDLVGSNQEWYDDVKIRKLKMGLFCCGTEASSFLALLDHIMSLNLSDDAIVYIVEDDYLHRPGWCKALREAFELPIDYVSLYDHADKYMEGYSELKSKIYVTESAHWRSTPSTCNTYACLMRTLREDIDTHRFFSRNHNGGVSQDHNKFVELARLGRRLITPMPGFSTHCEAGLLSPLVDWSKI